MIFGFALSCFAMALVYVGGLLVYRRNGPSSVIGRFSNFAVILYGLHLLLAIIALAFIALDGDGPALAAIAVILVSPLIIAQSFTFNRAGLALSIQILVLTAGGLWLTVLR